MLAVRFGPLTDLQDVCRSLTGLSNRPLHRSAVGRTGILECQTVPLLLCLLLMKCRPFVVRLCLCVSAGGWWEQWWLDSQLFAGFCWSHWTVMERQFDSMLLKHCGGEICGGRFDGMKGHWMKAVKIVVTTYFHLAVSWGILACSLLHLKHDVELRGMFPSQHVEAYCHIATKNPHRCFCFPMHLNPRWSLSHAPMSIRTQLEKSLHCYHVLYYLLATIIQFFRECVN